GRLRGDVEHVHVAADVAEIALVVALELQASDDDRLGRLVLLLLLVRARLFFVFGVRLVRVHVGHDQRQARRVRGPGQGGDAGLEAGQLHRLPALAAHEPDLRLLPLAPGEEREPLAVRAPARALLRLLARSEAQGGPARERCHVDVGVRLVLLGVHRGDGVGHPLAFGADLGIADFLQGEDVIRPQGARGRGARGGGRGEEHGEQQEHGRIYVPRLARVSNLLVSSRLPGGGMRPVPLVLALSLVALPAPAVDPPPSYGQMALDLLRQYLQVDTTNPPGNELKSARFYKEILDREGIPAEIDEFAPGRANLLATLQGSGARRALILANHMDVVPADASHWTLPPFSGAVKDGLIYGRGAQDMKSEGILQLVTLIRAKREGLALDRDIYFLATADEEVDFAGALRALSPAGWRDRLGRAEYFITEGGENVIGDDGKPQYFGIDTAEKGPFWLRLTTSGTPGHGSRPLADSALNRLVRALERVRLHKTEMKVLPGVQRFFRDQAGALDGPRAEWYRDLRKALLDPEAAQALYEDREASALLRNTISITVVKAGYKTNVIPGSAEA